MVEANEKEKAREKKRDVWRGMAEIERVHSSLMGKRTKGKTRSTSLFLSINLGQSYADPLESLNRSQRPEPSKVSMRNDSIVKGLNGG